MRASALILGLLLASTVGADEVYLKSGGHLSGNIIDQTETSVEIEIAAGHVKVPRSHVARIVTGESALSRYQARARALAVDDVQGWLDLAEWARSADLGGQARTAYEHVLQIDPENAAAHRGLAHQQVGDRWMARDDAMAAQGYVLFEGDWVTPARRDTILAEREASRQERAETERSRLALAEAEARAREAEARARAAEADARRAEDERQRASLVGLPPLWGYPGAYVVGAGPIVTSSGCDEPFSLRRCVPGRTRGGYVGFGLETGISSTTRRGPASSLSPTPTPTPKSTVYRGATASWP